MDTAGIAARMAAVTPSPGKFWERKYMSAAAHVKIIVTRSNSPCNDCAKLFFFKNFTPWMVFGGC